MNHHATSSPPPGEPGPHCAAYARLLPLLRTGELVRTQATVLDEHLQGCAWCRARLAEYDRLYAAMRRQFDPVAGRSDVSLPAVSDIAALARQPATRESDRYAPGQRIVRSTGSSLLVSLEAVAALLLVALLGTLLAWQHGSFGATTQVVLSAQERTYLARLNADYLPLLDTLGVENRQCTGAYNLAVQSDKPQVMLACRPLEAAVVSASQKLLSDLAATTPPARWQSTHDGLVQMAQALAHAYTDRIAAIDAHDSARFVALANDEVAPAAAMSCAPIRQMNADLPVTSRLPESATGACGP